MNLETKSSSFVEHFYFTTAFCGTFPIWHNSILSSSSFMCESSSYFSKDPETSTPKFHVCRETFSFTAAVRWDSKAEYSWSHLAAARILKVPLELGTRWQPKSFSSIPDQGRLVLIVSTSAVQWGTLIGAWYRNVMSEQGKWFGSGL